MGEPSDDMRYRLHALGFLVAQNFNIVMRSLSLLGIHIGSTVLFRIILFYVSHKQIICNSVRTLTFTHSVTVVISRS